MAQLKCPSCGSRGEVRGTEEFFAVRGRDPSSEYGWPVRKCLACGKGLVVKPRTFPPGTKAVAIDPETWSKMERDWEENFES
jgi:DNA-directed RNA polymerase subunit RPC12/RpoP